MNNEKWLSSVYDTVSNQLPAENQRKFFPEIKLEPPIRPKILKISLKLGPNYTVDYFSENGLRITQGVISTKIIRDTAENGLPNALPLPED